MKAFLATLKSSWERLLAWRGLSGAALWQVFSICLLAVESWALYNLVYEIPALRARETAWDLIGIVAIVQTVVLVESILVWLVVFGLALLLPGAWFGRRFVSQGSLLVLVSAAWAIWIHFESLPMVLWPGERLWLVLGLYLASVVAACLLVALVQPAHRLVQRVSENSTLLAEVYLIVTGLAVVVVIIRNL